MTRFRIECVECAKTVDAKKENGRFCGARCARIANDRRRKAAAPILNCAYCGSPFQVGLRTRFCSLECGKAFSRPKQRERLCARCGDPLSVEAGATAKFCDQACADLDKIERRGPRKRIQAAPGCPTQCTTCLACRLALALQASSADFEARVAKGES